MQPCNKKLKQSFLDFGSRMRSPAAAPSAYVPAASGPPATSEATSSTVVHASGSWPTDSGSPQTSSDHRANDPDRQIRRHPNQPMDVVFPTDTDNRKFLTSWYSSFGWIDYDLDSRTIFCHPCRQMYEVRDGAKYMKAEDAFVRDGFCNWKKAVLKLKIHEATLAHRANVATFQQMVHGDNVLAQLNAAYDKDRRTVRECLRQVFPSLQFPARQSLPTRGHVDAECNFKQLLRLRCQDSPSLRTWLERKTSWTSVEIQEEILKVMADEVQRQVVSEVQERRYFGLIADETADISQVEQLSICIRTVATNMKVDEKLLGFYALERWDGETVSKAILDVFVRLGIDINLCRGMTFDGASAFSSDSVGVQARIRQHSNSAVFTHCYMHCVNLAVQDIMKEVPIMRDFLQLVQDIVFLRNSPKRCAIVKTVAQSFQNTQTHIRPLCPTRFTVKYRALDGLMSQMEVVLQALDDIGASASENKIRSTASGFLKRLVDFDVVFCFAVAVKLFEITDRLSTCLQSKAMTAGRGVHLVNEAAALPYRGSILGRGTEDEGED